MPNQLSYFSFVNRKQLVQTIREDSKRIVIADSSLGSRYPELFEDTQCISLKAGEETKNLDTLERIFRAFHERNITRSHTVYRNRRR